MAHSPTPSSVRMAASSKGEGKKALAACDSWCSVKMHRRRYLPSSPLRISRGQVQFLRKPERHRSTERAEARRRKGQIGFQQPLELQQRFVVKTHVIELFRSQAGLLETVLNGMHRESVVVFDCA